MESMRDPFNSKKKLKEICLELGFEDTVTLLDLRTKQILDLYQFYKSAPHQINNGVWFQAFNSISQLEEALRPRLV